MWRFVRIWLIAITAFAGVSHAQQECRAWPQWQTFVRTHISPDGRVVDHSTEQLHTVSEAQAYAMFFALVAGDRSHFEALLQWSQNNLSGGDLSARLPGWQWGKTQTGQWGLLDSNSASDADLWMAYALLEAGRLWNQKNYILLGQSMAARLLASTTVVLPRLGRILLPAPIGFKLDAGRWRLNPSYVPMPVLRRMAALFPDSPWTEMLEPAVRFLVESAPAGFSPEWIIWDEQAGWLPDAISQRESSYNAIRTYLWAGMSRQDPSFERLALAFFPWLHWVGTQRATPERIDAFAPYASTKVNKGPIGFDAAALPLVNSLGLKALRDDLQNRIDISLAKQTPGYYSHALLLFAQGWMQGRYRFTADGTLLLPETDTCLP